MLYVREIRGQGAWAFNSKVAFHGPSLQGSPLSPHPEQAVLFMAVSRLADVSPGMSHPPWSSTGHCWLGSGQLSQYQPGWDFSKAPWHSFAVGRRGRGGSAPFSNPTPLLRDAPSLALGAVSFPQVLAGDQMFHALPGQSTFTPTAGRLLSPLGQERAGKQRGSHCTLLPHLPLSFSIPPWTPGPGSGWHVQPGGNSLCGTGTAKISGQVAVVV